MKSKIMRRLAALLMGVSVLVSCFALPASAASTTKIDQSTLVSTLTSQVGKTKVNGKSYKGRCLAFVADTFKNLGATRSSACCAYTYAKSHIQSTSMSDIPIGADVYFSGSSTKCSTCGNKAGHVGIYIGNGYMVHAWSTGIRKDKVSKIDAYNNLTFIGWGYHGNVKIVGSSSSSSGSSTSSKYYTPCTHSHSSIVDALKCIGVDSSYSFRKKIAAKNSISNYTGTASQNTKMLSLLKKGKLLIP